MATVDTQTGGVGNSTPLDAGVRDFWNGETARYAEVAEEETPEDAGKHAHSISATAHRASASGNHKSAVEKHTEAAQKHFHAADLHKSDSREFRYHRMTGGQHLESAAHHAHYCESC